MQGENNKTLMIQEKLLNLIKSQFRLDVTCDHGIKHWDKVNQIGIYLAKETGADVEVVNHFAYLHDSKRQDELLDSAHGDRSAVFVQELYKQGMIDLDKNQFEKLVLACRDHNKPSAKSEDITIQTCWDADRLDLWRVGIQPNPKYLFTSVAKQNLNIST